MEKALSEREKTVLYTMVRHPLNTDKEIAASTGLNLSTVTAIRRRLKDRGHYSVVRVPYLQDLGGEMLAVSYSHYRATVPLNIRLITGKRLAAAHKEVFWTASEYTQSISFQFSRNLTDAKRNLVELEELYTAQSFLDEGGITFITFPFEIARIPFFFDFGPLLGQSFGMNGNDKSEPIGLPTHKDRGGIELSGISKKVYRALIQRPELTDTSLSEKIGVSQKTITKLRKEFEAEGLMKTIIVPNLKKLGFKMLVFDHAKLNLRINRKQREEILKMLLDIKPPVFFASGGNDVVALTVYENFETYRRCINSFSEVYKHDDIFLREPKRLMFSLAEMDMLKEHAYSPIVDKILDVENS